MKTIIIGLGNQGKKRLKYIGKDFIASVDPINKEANYIDIKDVPLNLYDSAIVSVQEEYKYDIIKFLLNNKKNILVEKPLYFKSKKKLKLIFDLSKKNKVVIYVAYNHQFEKSIEYISDIIKSNKLGKLYCCELNYGNGTSKLVKKNKWRDAKLGVISDLGSHLFDLIYLWFHKKKLPIFKLIDYNNFENNAPDYALITSNSDININLKVSYCSWKNKFSCDLFFAKGSIHSNSLEKWENTTVIVRERVLPSGKPNEKRITFKKNQETWIKEYRHFKNLVKNNIGNDLNKDIWIQENLNSFENKLTNKLIKN